MHRLQQLLNQFVDRGMAAGVSLLINQRGQEAFFGYAGKQDLNSSAPFDRDTIMLMFSMTKVVTAAAIMTLIDKGDLTPETPVYEFIPEYRYLKVARPDNTLEDVKRPLTIHDLLTMTSGIPYPGGHDFVSACYGRVMSELSDPGSLTTLDMARLIARCPLCFQPGEHWMYGLSCEVLGGVIVAATGMELGAYMKKALFDPLGMKDASFQVPEDKHSRLATLYNVDKQGRFSVREDLYGFGALDKTRVEMGGAGLYATVDDFMKFGEMLRLEGAGVLSPEAVRLMARNHLTPDQMVDFGEKGSGYGYGYLVRTLMDQDKNEKYREQAGSFGWNGMGGTSLRIDPAREMTVVLGIQRVPPEHDDFIPPLMQTVAEIFG